MCALQLFYCGFNANCFSEVAICIINVATGKTSQANTTFYFSNIKLVDCLKVKPVKKMKQENKVYQVNQINNVVNQVTL